LISRGTLNNSLISHGTLTAVQHPTALIKISITNDAPNNISISRGTLNNSLISHGTLTAVQHSTALIKISTTNGAPNNVLISHGTLNKIFNISPYTK
jgi:spore coat protein U-like protein